MKQLVKAGIVLGFGMMGLLNGILFYQLFQWHHFVYNGEPASVLELQNQDTYDEIYHLVTWIITFTGIFMLMRSGSGYHIKPRYWTKVFIGSLMMGIGIFIFFEGFIDHQILGMHHLIPGPHQLLADLLFLGFGVVLTFIGYMLLRRKKEF